MVLAFLTLRVLSLQPFFGDGFSWRRGHRCVVDPPVTGSQVGSDKYPMVIQSWHTKYLGYVRTAIYTTNAAEAVHSQFQKLTKTKGGVASENSLLKLLYAGILEASEWWTRPVQNWNLGFASSGYKFCSAIYVRDAGASFK